MSYIRIAVFHINVEDIGEEVESVIVDQNVEGGHAIDVIGINLLFSCV
jgi:hypothetical protein